MGTTPEEIQVELMRDDEAATAVVVASEGAVDPPLDIVPSFGGTPSPDQDKSGGLKSEGHEETKGGEEVGSNVRLAGKWQGKTLELEVPLTSTIAEIKVLLQERTHVLAKRQKLMGLNIKSKPAPDETPLSALKLKDPQKFILMGTPEADLFVDPEDMDDLPEVFDDFDLEVSHNSEDWIRAMENQSNLEKFTQATEVVFMNPPRPGKRLLVLDLDHTLLDFSRRETHMESQKRPFMDDFLATVYEHYDLVAWSQTSWVWLETKLQVLGMMRTDRYKFCFVLDKTAMFHITSTLKDGSEKRHQVKPLKLIWSKFEQWSESNTVHVDDLNRNFALNPKNGVLCSAFYRKKQREKDVELVALAKYLTHVARLDEKEAITDHRDWRSHLDKIP